MLGVIHDITSTTTTNTKLIELYPSTSNESINYSGWQVNAYSKIWTHMLILDLIRQTCGNIYSNGNKTYRFVKHLPNEYQNNCV